MKEDSGAGVAEEAVAERCTITDDEQIAAQKVMALLVGKWTLPIVAHLYYAKDPVRFSRLQQEIDGISQKVLTQVLRRAELHGLVIRTQFAEVPPRVEYGLTAFGRKLVGRVFPVLSWIGSEVRRNP